MARWVFEGILWIALVNASCKLANLVGYELAMLMPLPQTHTSNTCANWGKFHKALFEMQGKY
jgi:hypothetical protein